MTWGATSCHNVGYVIDADVFPSDTMFRLRLTCDTCCRPKASVPLQLILVCVRRAAMKRGGGQQLAHLELLPAEEMRC